jgi:ABC-type transport system substrate-binding protein
VVESRHRLQIPVRHSALPQFDNDHPQYIPGSHPLYLTLALCYETLGGPTTVADTGGVSAPDFQAMQPRLAREVIEEPEGTWLVRLREGIVSNWGNELTSDSIRWGFEKAFETGNIGSWRWGQVGGVESPDSVQPIDRYTIRYRLRRPDPFFPSRLFWATPNVVDATEVRKHSSDEDPYAMEWQSENMAGFGPFSYIGGDHEHGRFQARKDYWSGQPPVSEVVLRRVDSRDEALAMLDGAEPVFLAGLRSDEVRALQQRQDIRFVSSWAGHASLEINYNAPPFEDIRVRHALSLATPYDRIIEDGFLGLARPWRSPIHTYAAWYTDQYWHYDTDAERAARLLADAGFGNGLTTQLFIPQRPDALRIAEILTASYKNIGVMLEIKDMAEAPVGWMPPLHLRLDCGHNLSEPLYDLAHDYAPLSPILPSGGRVGVGTWRPAYAGNHRLEEMYRVALLAPNEDTRRKRTLSIQRAIVEFAPAVFLAEQALFNAVNEYTHDWALDHSNRLNQVTLYQNANSSYLSR